MRADLVSAAESFAPRIREVADEVEQEACLPEDLVEQMTEAGLFRLYMPASAGGEEADPLTVFAVIEALAQADASVAWILMIAAEMASSVGWLEPEASRPSTSRASVGAVCGADVGVGAAEWGCGGRGGGLHGRGALGLRQRHRAGDCDGGDVLAAGAGRLAAFERRSARVPHDADAGGGRSDRSHLEHDGLARDGQSRFRGVGDVRAG